MIPWIPHFTGKKSRWRLDLKRSTKVPPSCMLVPICFGPWLPWQKAARRGDQSDQTRTRPVFWSTKVPLSFFVMLRQSIGAFGAVVFFQGKPKPMGFFLTNKKTTIQQQIYIQLGPGKVLACWSLPFPPLQNGQVCLYCGVTPMESLRILILRSSSP